MAFLAMRLETARRWTWDRFSAGQGRSAGAEPNRCTSSGSLYHNHHPTTCGHPSAPGWKPVRTFTAHPVEHLPSTYPGHTKEKPCRPWRSAGL